MAGRQGVMDACNFGELVDTAAHRDACTLLLCSNPCHLSRDSNEARISTCSEFRFATGSDLEFGIVQLAQCILQVFLGRVVHNAHHAAPVSKYLWVPLLLIYTHRINVSLPRNEANAQ